MLGERAPRRRAQGVRFLWDVPRRGYYPGVCEEDGEGSAEPLPASVGGQARWKRGLR